MSVNFNEPLGGRRASSEVRHVLRPYDRPEAISLSKAATRAGRVPNTVKHWCEDRGIGRLIGGRWEVSQVALQMYLDGNEAALKLYLAGNRDHADVISYFRHFGIIPKRQIR